VKWEEIKTNSYLKTQVGMIGAYRLIIRSNLEERMELARKLLVYLEPFD
jgi:hypothetical protein